MLLSEHHSLHKDLLIFLLKLGLEVSDLLFQVLLNLFEIIDLIFNDVVFINQDVELSNEIVPASTSCIKIGLITKRFPKSFSHGVES